MKKSKAKIVFDKLNRSDPRLDQHEDRVDFDKLNRDAVKSLFILPEAQKTEEGFEVV